MVGVIVFLLLAFFTFSAIKGYSKGKAADYKFRIQQAEAATAKAVKDNRVERPSWIGNAAFAKQLVVETRKAVGLNGMPPELADQWFAQQDVADALMTMAANMEKQGFGAFASIVGTADFAGKLAAAQMRHGGEAA